MKSDGEKIENIIVAKAKELGASVAGIARIDDLRASKSYEIYAKSPFYEEYGRNHPNYFKFKGVEWSEAHKSVLVWALAHPVSEPALDWWSMKVPGFTPGNRVMRTQSRKLRTWLGEELGISALSLPYQIEFGGAFLKDSAALAGLGIIGKHNLLVTSWRLSSSQPARSTLTRAMAATCPAIGPARERPFEAGPSKGRTARRKTTNAKPIR
jgi:epoxyqueuosine reductase